MDLRWSPELKSEGYPLGPDSFARCDCYECNFPHRCGCQAPAFDPSRPRGLHSFAYDRNGIFDLNFKGVSVECNVGCRCPATCQNRVVQRPRSVHIEIVKLEVQGWGVRARQDIVAGQVLGSFTGEIITREAASRITPVIATVDMSGGQKVKFRDRNQFLFDMDSRHNKYTLDCWAVGNWTRFINHKCEPNLKVASICYDTLPDTGLERLAVVALRDIPAGEEFGFDYHPTAKAGEGTISCSCGSQKCRGYI
ncbi:pre-SET motif protein [Rhizoctonia solani AG-3 Rhs1AP]|uniref:Pre-SET motif protein n=1 Tax=Rhizoctonia solani AG-3 Rhs1AP TaxID=1086054 RepID=X8JNE3_9AGAM|nr:pre-SET motif protein [Rhizoctonia solani AG-3 Rhs1AP]